ncbi:MAG: tRNA (guanosine(46)-N7)-methyltransferase TrmB [Muribaculaceae bacterium]|nr:tRNA (guanosine(46)-N7)-methyltransferase TrmB [Muribaculaceae bacterium]MDE6609224.1 tRNA (guanosine(46)-N7)-methyltransferase TrmB [Muribaculaceae bacterium]
MGKNKLKKFSEMKSLDFVFQYPWAELNRLGGFPLRGKWAEFFGNDNPITLELGCGKGEYTVGLAKQFPDRNFIGIDIKGARMWTGAKQAEALSLKNVAFLRTDIELLSNFFAPGEVASIWITFPDPQMQKPRKRLTATRMLSLYESVLKPGGIINLKTDSPFLFAYTKLLLSHNGITPVEQTEDLYNKDSGQIFQPALTQIQTHYEQQWLARGLTIKYLSFSLPSPARKLQEPPEAEEIPRDTYRSYSRGVIQGNIQPTDQE